MGTATAETWNRTSKLKALQKAAAKGDPEAEYTLGLAYDYILPESGQWSDQVIPGISRDIKKSHELVRKAADHGLTQAQVFLGKAYHLGINGVTQDDEEAAKWWRKAADQGDSGAQLNIGDAYHNGWSVEKDDKEAIKWWRKAAKYLPEAQKRLDLYAPK